jgi:hypothetical protein
VTKKRSVAEGDEQSIPNLPFVYVDAVLLAQAAEFVLEISLGVMFFLYRLCIL